MNKATRIDFFNFSTPQMRAFHMTWLAFFLCFFGWFGLAPMLKVVREDLGMTTDQVMTTSMCAVASTILMRLLIGWLCDLIGPRLAYSGLLVLGSIPVMAVGLAHDATTFLLLRVAIGAIGAAFVITQYHTSAMFAPNCVGFANAVTAGWGNSGAGATHFLMPVLFAAVVSLVGSESTAWRLTMVIPGVALLFTGIAYFLLVQDTPDGNFPELRAAGRMAGRSQASGGFVEALRDIRVWALFLIYGACFGVELLIDSTVALYLSDSFEMSLTAAGVVGGLFGAMGLYARPLGGWVADRISQSSGLKGRVMWLFLVLFIEGIAVMAFSQANATGGLVAMLAVAGLFVHMGCGATFAIVPFINRNATGAVSGIVGAGGNAFAVLLMLLFKPELTGLAWSASYFVTGASVVVLSFTALVVTFTPQDEAEFRAAREANLSIRHQTFEPVPVEAS